MGREAPPPRKLNREGEPGSDSSFRVLRGGSGRQVLYQVPAGGEGGAGRGS